MTPYSFAFTIIRVIAVLLLADGAVRPLGFLYELWFTGQGRIGEYPGDFSFTANEMALTVFPGLLLYFLAPWLAKLAVWKIRG
jgi:hypothetical protein